MQRKHRQGPTQSARDILQQISQVVHNRDRDRFELRVAGDLVGVLGYSEEMVDGKRVITVLHTIIYDEYTGHGLGTRLTRGALAYFREQGVSVRPVCAFTREYLNGHPGIVPLVPV
ncbi:MAG: GNAT family N-acetyltransferase [Gordonia sp. (in: high G+C Gram-positive bacteria)]